MALKIFFVLKRMRMELIVRWWKRNDSTIKNHTQHSHKIFYVTSDQHQVGITFCCIVLRWKRSRPRSKGWSKKLREKRKKKGRKRKKQNESARRKKTRKKWVY